MPDENIAARFEARNALRRNKLLHCVEVLTAGGKEFYTPEVVALWEDKWGNSDWNDRQGAFAVVKPLLGKAEDAGLLSRRIQPAHVHGGGMRRVYYTRGPQWPRYGAVAAMSRRQCTKDNPYTSERDKTEPGRGWEHDGAHEVGEQEDGWPGGDIITVKCQNCGTRWKEELPQ